MYTCYKVSFRYFAGGASGLDAAEFSGQASSFKQGLRLVELPDLRYPTSTAVRMSTQYSVTNAHVPQAEGRWPISNSKCQCCFWHLLASLDRALSGSINIMCPDSAPIATQLNLPLTDYIPVPVTLSRLSLSCCVTYRGSDSSYFVSQHLAAPNDRQPLRS